jgi:hypothetical protein
MTTILEFHNVIYLFDGKKYYKKINNHTLKNISKEEFYEKSKYNPKTIDKLLHQSEYPYQINDYILLTIPKWLKIKLNLKKRYIPADYQLANLIKFLWKKKIIMFHWNQPKNKFGGIGSIDCYKNTLNGEDVVDIFIKLFGEYDCNITIYDFKLFPSLKKINIETFIKKYPNRIIIIVFPEYIHIEFLQKKFEWIHKKLNITIPKKSDSSKGGIILNPDEISSCNIV